MFFSSNLVGALVSLGLFCILLWQVTTDGSWLRADQDIADWLGANAGSIAVRLGNSLSHLGGPIVLGVTVAAAVWGLALQRQWRVLVSFCCAIAGSGLTVAVTKALTDRVRPDINTDLVTVGSSFPSASTAMAAVVFVGCASLVLPRLSSANSIGPFRLGLVLVPVVVGFSRVLVSAHYMTDVVAGLCIGAFYVFVARFFTERAVA